VAVALDCISHRAARSPMCHILHQIEYIVREAAAYMYRCYDHITITAVTITHALIWRSVSARVTPRCCMQVKYWVFICRVGHWLGLVLAGSARYITWAFVICWRW
jgi:hypothetical protein